MLALLLLGGLGGAGYAVMTHQPAFYEMARVPAGPERLTASHEFEQRAQILANQAAFHKSWNFSCSTQQINSYFVEDFLKTKLLPDYVHDLRVQFLDDELRLGFQYGEGHLKTVISMHAKAWLSPRDPNTIVIEFISLQAGAMPFGIKAFHEEIGELLRKQHIKVLWYRKDGHPTMVLKFQSDRREPSFHFKRLEFKQGHFHLEGETLDPEAPKQ